MATEITMPKLSDTMEEGTLLSWKKSVGDRIKRGDIIAEVETDKANMELEAFVSGELLEIRVKAGEVVPVGTVIAIVGAEGEKPEPKPAERDKKRAGEKELEVKGKKEAPDRESEALEEGEPPPPEPEPQEEEELPAPEREEAEAEEEAVSEEKPKERKEEPGKLEEPSAAGEKASPLVRRMAREHRIALSDVEATGPDGRVTKEDLERYMAQKEKEPEPSKKEVPPRAPEGKPEPLSRMRAAIAKNVTASWQSIPHFYVGAAIDMGEAEALHRGLAASGAAVSINDMIVKAVAMALRQHPDINASFSDEGIVRYPAVNIGIAVSVEGGLLVPVVRGCEKLSLKEIAARSRELVEKARNGMIGAADISGGTFTVSNMGMFGVDNFSAVIYPGQAGILAIAAITDTVSLRDGRFVPARMMRVNLSADHRAVDGVNAARFLSELKNIMENPYMMLV